MAERRTHASIKDKQLPVKELPNSSWYTRVLEGMEVNSLKAVMDLRTATTRDTSTSLWCYPCAGVDITPILLAPPTTRHAFIDFEYDGDMSTYHDLRDDMSGVFVSPFTKLGALVKQQYPWPEALARKRQAITIDERTIIELIGANTRDERVLPEPIDVIYNNFQLGMQIHALLPHLKKQGLYVIAESREFYDIHTDPENYDFQIRLGDDMESEVAPELMDLSLYDFGFVETHAIRVPRLYFPAIGSIPSSTDESDTVFRVLEKTREFTPEEVGILFRIDSLRR